MTKKPFTVQLTNEARARLDRLGEACHLSGTTYSAMLLGKLSNLKPEFALSALEQIPRDCFRSGPDGPTEVQTTFPGYKKVGD